MDSRCALLTPDARYAMHTLWLLALTILVWRLYSRNNPGYRPKQGRVTITEITLFASALALVVVATATLWERLQ